ncbi:MAG TPA: KH domain-containing protein [Pyrinomonadaceae bacterium]|nr:KH domain-containing protein [Pyrinomonadaceae bacterium]
MKDTIEMIVRALVDDPDGVDLREVERNGTSIIEIRVAQSDMGKIIGRQGRTIRALRTLANAAGIKQKRRFILEIVE